MLRRAGAGGSLMKDLRRNRSREVRSGTLQRLAAALNCSIDELYAGPPKGPGGVHERAISALEPPSAAKPALETAHVEPPPRRNTTFLMVPEYDVRASAGGGSVVENEEVRALWPWSRAAMEALRIDARNLAIVEVVGDSMLPTLCSGDKVMVDLGDKRIGIPGLFAIWDGDGLVAKRVERIWSKPGEPQRLKLISDNSAHSPYEVDAEWVQIIGRVVLLVRRF